MGRTAADMGLVIPPPKRRKIGSLLRRLSKKLSRQPRTYFKFYGCEMNFQGQLVSLEGRKLFEFPHIILEPPQDVLDEIESDLRGWIQENFPPHHAIASLKFMEETVMWVYTDGPRGYHNRNDPNYPINRKKRNMYSKHTLMAWVYDIFDQLKPQEYYREFSQWTIELIKDIFAGKFFPSDTEFKNGSESECEQNSKSNAIKNGMRRLFDEIGHSQFASVHPLVETYFQLCFTFAAELKYDWGLTEEQYEPYVESYVSQYKHETWLDYNADRHLVNIDLRKTLRSFTVGMRPFVELACALDGIRLTYEERHDKSLKRLKYLLFYQVGLVNDIFSVKKEIENEEPDNLILLYCRHENLSFAESLKKVIKEHDQIHDEAKEIYNYLNKNNPKDSNMAKYIRHLIDVVGGNTIFYFFCARYGNNLKWEVETE